MTPTTINLMIFSLPLLLICLTIIAFQKWSKKCNICGKTVYLFQDYTYTQHGGTFMHSEMVHRKCLHDTSKVCLIKTDESF